MSVGGKNGKRFQWLNGFEEFSSAFPDHPKELTENLLMKVFFTRSLEGKLHSQILFHEAFDVLMGNIEKRHVNNGTISALARMLSCGLRFSQLTSSVNHKSK